MESISKRESSRSFVPESLLKPNLINERIRLQKIDEEKDI